MREFYRDISLTGLSTPSSVVSNITYIDNAKNEN